MAVAMSEALAGVSDTVGDAEESPNPLDPEIIEVSLPTPFSPLAYACTTDS